MLKIYNHKIGKKSGIYAVRNKITSKLYIGHTSHFGQRRSIHFYELRKNKHKNSQLQADYNQYGDNNFDFVILEETENLVEAEQKWLNKIKNKYNVIQSAAGVSDATKKKISEANKKRYKDLSEEEKELRRKNSRAGAIKLWELARAGKIDNAWFSRPRMEKLFYVPIAKHWKSNKQQVEKLINQIIEYKNDFQAVGQFCGLEYDYIQVEPELYVQLQDFCKRNHRMMRWVVNASFVFFGQNLEIEV